MNYLTIEALQDRLKPLGRTLPDPQSGVLYCNWTQSGVEILFRGRTLAADLCALPGAEADRSPLTGQITERPPGPGALSSWTRTKPPPAPLRWRGKPAPSCCSTAGRKNCTASG